jgi:HlyD family secretion protein
MTQNVITYIVEVLTDNSSGRLLPYLTANVQFEIERKDDTLLVPNSALRWTPSPERIAPEFRKKGEKAIAKDAMPEGQKTEEKFDKPVAEGRKRTTLWVLRGEFVEPLRVKTGLTDGTLTAVKGDGLTEGLEVVTGLQTQAAGQSGTANPFIPQFGRGRGGGR